MPSPFPATQQCKPGTFLYASCCRSLGPGFDAKGSHFPPLPSPERTVCTATPPFPPSPPAPSGGGRCGGCMRRCGNGWRRGRQRMVECWGAFVLGPRGGPRQFLMLTVCQRIIGRHGSAVQLDPALPAHPWEHCQSGISPARAGSPVQFLNAGGFHAPRPTHTHPHRVFHRVRQGPVSLPSNLRHLHRPFLPLLVDGTFGERSS